MLPRSDQASTSVIDETVRRVHRHFVNGTARAHPDVTEIERVIVADGPLLSESEVRNATRQVANQLFALGPLESLLEDPTITEIMVNGPGPVWVERLGTIVPTSVTVDDAMLRIIIDRIVGPLGLRIDRTAPFIDARLTDGSRVHIAVPPLALDGPYLTIRRFRAQAHRLSDFCSPATEAVLISALRGRKNMVISGGTGSGKTSLLNALASHLQVHERVITIEDAAELRLPGDHTVRLEARPANAEGVGGCTIRTLVRNALRMRPDRVIVGEVRGAEAIDMVQAMNTGHDGSMSTCHANSPVDTLRRLEAMLLMGDIEMPIEVVRDHVRAAVDLVIFVTRMPGGGRRVRDVYAYRDDTWLVRDHDVVQAEAG